jgi:GT2 family glycosyltransferase
MLPYRSLVTAAKTLKPVRPLVTISIVSHGHGPLVKQTLSDLAQLSVPIEVLLTLNIPESPSSQICESRIPVRRIDNRTPRGFGANHNSAFAQSAGTYFCVINPDVRIKRDPFPVLLDCLEDPSIGVVAPCVTAVDGALEDSARNFPTLFRLFAKALGAQQVAKLPLKGVGFPDWIAGMFMLFPRHAFERVGGFDEAYFLYYEDVDICARLHRAGYRVAYCADAAIIHDARRQSRRELRYMRLHLRSMLRFLMRRAMGIL